MHPWLPSPPVRLTDRVDRKVPFITGTFWAIKILSTGAGEAVSDYAVHRFDPVIAVMFGFVVFAVALGVQLVARRYIPWIYWLAATMVAIFGTMAADVIHVRLGVPYVVSFIGFAVALVVAFGTWYAIEGTLSIHDVDTHRRELFYWAAVLITFALGTATGDLTAYTLHLGFLSSGLLFTAAIRLPAFAYRNRVLGEVGAFWGAYIVTRPLGASFADWLGTPHAVGGLNLGRGRVSVTLLVAIAALVAYVTYARRQELDSVALVG